MAASLNIGDVRVEESVLIPHKDGSSRRDSQNSQQLATTPGRGPLGQQSSITPFGSEANFWESSINRAFSVKSMSYEDLRHAFKMVERKPSATPIQLNGSFEPDTQRAEADGVNSAPAGELMQTIAATVVQCSVRRLLAKKLVRIMKGKKQEDFERQCGQDAEVVAAVQIQQLVRKNNAEKEVKALRGASGDSFQKLGIAASAATVKHVPAGEPNAAGGENGGGDLMRECAAELIQTNYRKHRVYQRVEAKSRGQSFAVPEDGEGDQELEGESFHVDANSSGSVKNPPNSARTLRNKVAASREQHEAPSFLGWGSSQGAGLSQVFASGEDFVLSPANAFRPLWGIRALHSAAQALSAPNYLPELKLKRWVEGPLGVVMQRTAQAAAQNAPQ